MSLFTVTDLSTVWVVAGLYERDFSAAAVGAPATVTFGAYPGLTLRGECLHRSASESRDANGPVASGAESNERFAGHVGEVPL
jgi:multidrug resistance efflux pump